ncbi:MAG: DUF6095 family protein [Bacilli bacterium]|nr:DUF6095 family protein [Bacilli bacterium]
MGFILYFDYAAIALLLFLIASVIVRKQYKNTSNKLYLALLFITLLSSVADIFASVD